MPFIKELLNFILAILLILLIQFVCLLLEWIAYRIGGFWGWVIFSILFYGYLLRLGGMFDD